jgi:predicted SAM-dependent methyltransferase
MIKLLKFIKNILLQMGIEPKKGINSLRGFPFFLSDLRKYNKMAKGNPNAMPVFKLLPVMHERFSADGNLDPHYFYQDLWAARKIYKDNPIRHVDIGSGVATFVSHLLTFRQVEIVDVRPIDLNVSGLTTTITDATHLTSYLDNSLESISTLHAGEHFGLGRYGDPINPEGHILFMKSLARVLKPGGKLYYSVPCGIERLYFHAHRVISPQTILKSFNDLKLISFSCVTDDAKFHENCEFSIIENQEYGCGMFEFTKI